MISDTTCCLACGSQHLRLVESVPIAAIADAWAREKAHGPAVSKDDVQRFIHSDTACKELEIWCCANCGLEMGSPLRSWSDKHYPLANDAAGFDHHVVLNELRDLPPLHILDIGCGDGQFLERVGQLGHQPVGIDFSDADVRAIQSRKLAARVADASSFIDAVEEKGPFHVITLFQVIEHLSDPDNTFAQIERIAAENATLFIGCPSNLRFSRFLAHPAPLTTNDFWDYPPHHTLRWTRSALEQFLASHGWHIESFRYENFSLIAATAYMTALHGLAQGWYGDGRRRRLETVRWAFRVATCRLMNRMTGIRMVLKARRT